MLRSLWNGTVAFGMVRVPVKLYSATESKAIRFNERHATDGAPIVHRRVCALEDREVPYEEVVKGFEVSEGSYVPLTKSEIAAVDGPNAHVIAIEHFVQDHAIDALYFERPYYLGPGGATRTGSSTADSYLVLQAALRRTGRVGIGRFVFHNNARLVAVRALGDVIALHTMRYADEVSPTGALDGEGQRSAAGAAAAAIDERELDTAMLLIERLSARFEAHKYRDKHREALLEMIERKARGETLKAPEAEPATGGDELLEALEASLKSHSRRRRTVPAGDGQAGPSSSKGTKQRGALAGAGAGSRPRRGRKESD